MPVAIPDGVEVRLSGRTMKAPRQFGNLRLMVRTRSTLLSRPARLRLRTKNETKAFACDGGGTDARARREQHGDSVFRRGFSITLKSNVRGIGGGQGQRAPICSGFVTNALAIPGIQGSPAKDRP